MCGIAGIWGEGDEHLVKSMLQRLAHRGPDGEGIYQSRQGSTVLGHRRLAIIDPAGGNQPMEGREEGRAIVANGEIYNFRQLRERLSATRFQTKSDTEVILRLYEHLGDDAVDRLDGMFAFVVSDGDHVFAARDPVGIKPLYLGRNGCSLYFASELKALAGIAHDIHEFPPGTTFHSGRGFRRFCKLPEGEPKPLALEEIVRRVRRTLEAAIVKRLMSDVSLGAFLSGGLDSSLIAAIARRHMAELHTFSVGVEGSRDLEAARQVARYLDTVHHEYTLSRGEILDRLPEIIYHLESYDQDLVRSAIPCYFTARLAADYVKVVLTGEGADELFAGYKYYRKIHNSPELHRELIRSVSVLHNVNLQRVDRMTMAHGIEGRVPFLDLELIRVAQSISPEWKLRRDASGRLVEKWVLRKACEDLLPPEIIWRDKEQFDEGSGTVDLLTHECDRWLKPGEVKRYSDRHRAARLRSAEECKYHKLLTDCYPDTEPILSNIARWADRPLVV